MSNILLLFMLLLLIFFNSCNQKNNTKKWKLQKFEVANPVNTNTKKIELQKRQTFQVKSLYASNMFKGARLNDFYNKGDSIFAEIYPERYPINDSPWYAFKLWSLEEKEYTIYLKYKHGNHRYHPKISKDFITWTQLDNRQVNVIDSSTVALSLSINTDTLYIAAQPVQNSIIVQQWLEEKTEESNSLLREVGKSMGGKALYRLEIGNKKNKPTICLLTRQHPPEVTGWFALKEFTNYLLEENPLNKRFLSEFNVLVYPLLNPDGVDDGHWRYNFGGIDLNRDWAFYRQPETQKVAASIIEYANSFETQIVLGVDFHSTYYDVFYENHDPSFNLILPNFKKTWINAIQKSMPEEVFKVSEIEVGKPINMDWFSRQFGALGITYEIGDDTPYERIEIKAQNAARTMMELLLEWSDSTEN